MQEIKTKEDANIFQKLVYFLKYIVSYWNKPPKGSFLPFREFAAYCVGGMGVTGMTIIPQFVTLTAGLYIAVSLGVSVQDIVIVGIISNIIVILRSPILSWIIDNTNSRIGKFRPWLVWLPIPIILLLVALVFIPHALMSNYILMLVSFTIIFNLLQFIMTIYGSAYNTLVLVISPSHQERTNLLSIGSVIYSLGPSIVNALFPLLANILYTTKQGTEIITHGINDIRAMQVIVPIMAAAFLAVGLLTAFGVKERFVQKKATVNKVDFKTGVKSVAKNKYFWINTFSTILGVFRLMGTSYVAWIATYYLKSEWAQSVLVTIAGSACVPGMLLAPLLIKKFGKKKVIIAIHTLCALFTIPIVLAASVPTPATPIIIYIMILLITVFNGATIVTAPAIIAMINDYQQYKTGQRIEGFVGQFSGMLLTAVGIGTAFIAPAIYAKYGFVKDASVLYNTKEVTSPIILWTSLIGVASGLFSIIPYIFWDLSEKRHGRIMEILAVRAHIGNGKISEEEGKVLEARIESGESGVAENLIGEVVEDNKDSVEDSLSVADFIEVEHKKTLSRKEIKANSTKEEWAKYLEEEKILRKEARTKHKEEVLIARQRDKELEKENWELTKENRRKEKEERLAAKNTIKAEKALEKSKQKDLISSLSKEERVAYKTEKKEENKAARMEKRAMKQEQWIKEIEREKEFKAIEKENSIRDAQEEKAERMARKEERQAKKELKKSMTKEEIKEYNAKSKQKSQETEEDVEK